MKLYLLTQDENRECGTYDSMVVAAESTEEARNIHPYGKGQWSFDVWAIDPSNVNVVYLGVAAEGVVAGRILGSFNAG